jgi:hypothetical protein
MAKLKVYDRKNPDRFLGTLTVDRPIHGRMVSVACIARQYVIPGRYYRKGSVPDFAMDRADFEVEWQHETKADSWHHRHREEWMILLTDTPLEHLLMIDKFMLPGEDATDAYRRTHDFY